MLYVIASIFLIPFVLDYREKKTVRENFIAEILEKGK